MGQVEVLELLKENRNKWYNANEIAEIFNINPESIRTNLKHLKDWNLVRVKTHHPIGKALVRYYKYKGKE